MTNMINFASAEDEALTREPDCEHEDADHCEHADHWRALDASTARYLCEDCRYTWTDGAWTVTDQCRACGEEDYALWEAGL